MINRNSILEIRKHIPIGISDAKILLEETNSNVDIAISTWKERQEKQLSETLSVKVHDAKELLQYVKYDLNKALSVFRERNTADVQKIIESSDKEYTVMSNFHSYVHKILGIDHSYGGWIQKEGFDRLIGPVKEVLMVYEWYAIYDYEGVSVEQGITEDVIAILENKFELVSFATNLKSLKIVLDKFHAQYPYKKYHGSRSAEWLGLRYDVLATIDSKKYDQEIMDMEEIVYKKAYSYLVENADEIDTALKSISKD